MLFPVLEQGGGTVEEKVLWMYKNVIASNGEDLNG